MWIIKIIKFNAPPRILNEHWCIYSCLQIPPKENWFQYVRRVYTTAINFPCITPLTVPFCFMKSVFNCTVRLLYKLIKSPVRYLKWTGVYCDLFILSSIIMYCVLHPQLSFRCVLHAVICSTLTEEIIEFSGEWLIYPFIYLSIYSLLICSFTHLSIF